MYFWKEEKETPLINALVNNDLEAIERLKGEKEQVFAKNFLGFNALQMAKYLEKEALLTGLSSFPEKTFKVRFKGEKELKEISQEDFEKFFDIRYLRCLKFCSYSLFKEVVKSCCSLMKQELQIKGSASLKMLEEKEGSPEIFPLRYLYYKDKIESGYVAPSRIEWIDDIIGYGLFADKDFKKGDYIGEYVGEVKREALWLASSNYSILYPNKSWKSYCIEGRKEGNEIRFANHSYSPNIKGIAVVENGLIHSIFVADKEISKGKELLWNYGERFWASKDPPQEI